MPNEPSDKTPSNANVNRNLNLNPFPLSSYQLSPAPALSFSAIIEQDHTQINAAAGRLLRLAHTIPSKPPSTPQAMAETKLALRSQLELVTVRLIRHDVSEDLVMRPTMIRRLGAEGFEMARHDRDDHEEARVILLGILERELVFDREDHNEEASSTPLNRGEEEAMNPPITLSEFTSTITSLFQSLAEHMRVESGEQIPRLESVLGHDESLELAKMYLRTQILMPELALDGEKVWKGGFKEYVTTEAERWKEIWGLVEAERKRREGETEEEKGKGKL